MPNEIAVHEQLESIDAQLHDLGLLHGLAEDLIGCPHGADRLREDGHGRSSDPRRQRARCRRAPLAGAPTLTEHRRA